MSEKTVNEVLRHLLFDYTREEIDTGNPIDQAKSDILRILKSKMPTGKDVVGDWFSGYNVALADCRSAISNLFREDKP